MRFGNGYINKTKKELKRSLNSPEQRSCQSVHLFKVNWCLRIKQLEACFFRGRVIDGLYCKRIWVSLFRVTGSMMMIRFCSHESIVRPSADVFIVCFLFYTYLVCIFSANYCTRIFFLILNRLTFHLNHAWWKAKKA